MIRHYWWNDKLYQYTHRQLRNIWMTAKLSQKRCYVWGSLATFAWICGVSQLEPPQKSKRIWPHLAMIVIAAGISQTMKEHFKKASETQKQVRNLLRGLRRAHTPVDVEEIRKATCDLAKNYPIIREYTKE